MATTNITMFRNPAKAFGCHLLEGETGPVEEALAKQLVALRLAVDVDQPKQIQGVPDSPKITGAEPAAFAESAPPAKHTQHSKPKP
jgi:hypothetical protein